MARVVGSGILGRLEAEELVDGVDGVDPGLVFLVSELAVWIESLVSGFWAGSWNFWDWATLPLQWGSFLGERQFLPGFGFDLGWS